jgi:hypothetical protein
LKGGQSNTAFIGKTEVNEPTPPSDLIDWLFTPEGKAAIAGAAFRPGPRQPQPAIFW